jgi:hypothetical protein
MSYFNGPYITKNGLVLCLDANNTKSYPGSGSIWYDLSNTIGNLDIASRNNDWSFVNDPQTGQRCIYNTTNRTSNAGINIPTNTGFNKNAGTIEIWLKPTDNTGAAGFFVNGDGVTYTNVTGWFWFGGWNNNSTIYFRQTSTASDLTYSGSTHYNLNQWMCLGIRWSIIGANSRINMFKNTTVLASYTGNATQTANVGTTTGQIFNGHSRTDNAQFKGYCNSYRIYNRYLEDDELRQNYNTLKGRFNL